MRIANVADVHIANHRVMGGEFIRPGINKRCGLVFATLEFALRRAHEEGCKVFVVNGDLFDTAKPSPQHLAETQRVLGQYPEMQKVILLGNHDMESAEEGDNALGPLRPVAQIIEQPTILRFKDGVDAVELWAVPFRPGQASEWLPTVLAGVQGSPSSGAPASLTRVLALHLGLQDGKTPPWLKDAHDSVSIELLQELMVKHDFKACYAGNWHEPFDLDWRDTESGKTRYIVQIGTLCPTGWDNPGLGFGTMAIFDSHKPKLNKIIHVPGPRFVSHVSEAIDARAQKCQVFIRLKTAPEDMPGQQGVLEELKKQGAEGELVLDTAETQAALRTAVGVTRSATTLEEAVAGFVAQMPLEEMELRPFVMERVKHFLGAAE